MTSTMSCVKCKEMLNINPCDGCQKYFCSSHISDHQAELAKQMDRINQDTTEEQIEHLLLSQINTWETQSIKKIQNAAQVARNDLKKILTNKFHLTNCPEIQLNQWMETIKRIEKFINH